MKYHQGFLFIGPKFVYNSSCSGKGKILDQSMTGKTVLITGANSGIGKEAALQLAEFGACVIMACRSEERGEKARLEILQKFPNAELIVMPLDLSSQASIKILAEQIIANFQRLDVLIHNAANFDLTLKKPLLTKDGVETIFATNHIGPFLLTRLLLDLLKESVPSRIITVASKGLLVYPSLDIEFDNLNGERKYSAQKAYYHSKLAQIMFTYDLAERLEGTGVTVNCIRVPSVAVPDERLAELPGFLKKLYSLKRSMSITPARMAETYVYLASDPAAGQISGKLWDETNKQVKSNRNSYDRETWKRLWQASEKLLITRESMNDRSET